MSSDQPPGGETVDNDPVDQHDEAVDDAELAEPEDSAPARPTRRRLSWQAQLAVALVCLLLGLGLAMQVRLASSAERDLRGARQEDLVRILDELDARENQLQGEIDNLQATRDGLVSGGDQSAVAADEAQKRADQLAILAGTVAATGPGVVLSISDPTGSLPPEAVIDIIQELRASSAEAIQIGPVRIGMTTAVGGEPGKVTVDGTTLQMPVDVLAIGDPATMSTAMGIPGGVIATVKYAGADITVTESQAISITALRSLETPDYAQPAAPTS